MAIGYIPFIKQLIGAAPGMKSSAYLKWTGVGRRGELSVGLKASDCNALDVRTGAQIFGSLVSSYAKMGESSILFSGLLSE